MYKNIIRHFIKITRLLRRKARQESCKLKARRRKKVFVIGLNKTGTTTMAKALHDLGYMLASEREAKPLFHAWLRRDFKPIIEYCKTAQAFQDSPFSFPETFKSVDQAFPGSKFILTVRDDEDQWYGSITRFHSKLWGDGDGTPPTQRQLKEAVNSYKGRPWDVNQALFKTPRNDPYNEEILKTFYLDYNKSVMDYFSGRSDDFLVLNVAEAGAYKRFVDFLGVESDSSEFPWENRT
ncbi:MAG: sulfotransferase [Marinobacter sp.]